MLEILGAGAVTVVVVGGVCGKYSGDVAVVADDVVAERVSVDGPVATVAVMIAVVVRFPVLITVEAVAFMRYILISTLQAARHVFATETYIYIYIARVKFIAPLLLLLLPLLLSLLTTSIIIVIKPPCDYGTAWPWPVNCSAECLRTATLPSTPRTQATHAKHKSSDYLSIHLPWEFHDDTTIHLSTHLPSILLFYSA